MENQLDSEPVVKKDTPCFLCGGQDDATHEFNFYYGKQKKVTTQYHYPEKIKTYTYEIGGVCSEYICHKCFKKYHMQEIYAGYIILFILIAGSIIVKSIYHSDSYPFILVLIEIAMALGIVDVYRTIKRNKNNYMSPGVISYGSRMLMERKKRHFRELGYDKFWTPKEYDQLDHTNPYIK